MVRLFYRLIALLMISTASLKLWMLLNDPFADLRTGYPTWFLVLVITLEITVFWAVIHPDWNPVHRWALVLVTFMIFSCFSFYAWMIGSNDCGCFGSISVSPKISLLISLLTVTILGTARKHFLTYQDHNKTTPFNQVIYGIIGTAFGIAILLGFNPSHSASSPHIISMVNYDSSTGSTSDNSVQFNVFLTNRSSKAVKVIGFHRSCTCLGISGALPRIIEPNESERFHVMLSYLGMGNSNIRQRVIFYLDSPNQYAIAVEIDSQLLSTASLSPQDPGNRIQTKT